MNPSGSSELDTLDFPEEWNLDKKHETSTDYLRGLDNPQREQLVRVPTDGTAVIWNAPFKPLSVDIINSTGQSLNITDEVGDIIQVAGGSLVSMPVNGSAHYTFQLASADSTKRACFCIFYRYRRSVAGASAAGGAATSVTIAGPLDGSGNVKTALEASLPAGTAVIGGVELVDAAGTNKAAIDGSGNVATKVTTALPAGTNVLGYMIIQGTVGNFQQDANGNMFVMDRSVPNFAHSQTATSNVATSIAPVRNTRVRCEIRNLDSVNSVYIGTSTVTTANGILLKPGESRPFFPQTAIYAVAAAGTPSIEIADYYA